jgi:hypothetical protein
MNVSILLGGGLVDGSVERGLSQTQAKEAEEMAKNVIALGRTVDTMDRPASFLEYGSDCPRQTKLRRKRLCQPVIVSFFVNRIAICASNHGNPGMTRLSKCGLFP